MEEVDGIIIRTLKSIGCDFDDDDVQSLSQLTTEQTVESAARCIKTINNEIDVPHKLPPSMSARFRVGSSLAKAVQDLGYRGDVGYQTFLYSNEAEVRRVFIFLVEKLPKHTSTEQEETLGASAQLQRAISLEIKRRLAMPWTPAFCKSNGVCWRGSPPQWHREGVSGLHHFHSCPLAHPSGLEDVSHKLSQETRAYYRELPYVHRQPPRTEQLAASILDTHASQLSAQHEWEAEWNQLALTARLTPEEYRRRKGERVSERISECVRQSVTNQQTVDRDEDLTDLLTTMAGQDRVATKGSRFTHTQKLQFSKDDEKLLKKKPPISAKPQMRSKEEEAERKEEELETLKNELENISAKLEATQLSIRKMKSGIQKGEERVTSLEDANTERKTEYRVKKKTLDLLPDAETNIARLEELVETSTARLARLNLTWDKHRRPLEAELQALRADNTGKQSELDKKLGEIRDIRAEMKESATDARGKDELLRLLRGEYENMTKDVNRSAYTKRILEIVSNIKKQKHQIDQVLLDTKVLQKEINSLTGKLDRTFTVTDELIFKDAKKDECVRRSYKQLAALHQNCSCVIHTVEATGVILREIRQLEDMVEQERKKNIGENLSKITADYKSMKAENTSLVNKIKKQQTS